MAKNKASAGGKMKKIFKLIIFTAFTIVALTFSASAKTAGKVVTQEGRLNLRQSPSTSSTVITSVKKRQLADRREKRGQLVSCRI